MFIFSDFARSAAKQSTNIVVDKFAEGSNRMDLENNFRNDEEDHTFIHDVVSYARALGGQAMSNDDTSFVVDNGKWMYMFNVCGMMGDGGVAVPMSDRKELIASLVAAINC